MIPEIRVKLPEWYDDLAEFECEAKGCAVNFSFEVNGKAATINFYDLTRFNQDAADDLKAYGYFDEESVVILPRVTRKNIIEYLNRKFP